VISDRLGDAHTRRRPMKLAGKGSGSKYSDDAYVGPRLRGSMAAAGGSSGGSSSRWWAKAVEEARKGAMKGR
jgi:hypothetical protein